MQRASWLAEIVASAPWTDLDDGEGGGLGVDYASDAAAVVAGAIAILTVIVCGDSRALVAVVDVDWEHLHCEWP